MSSHLLTLPEWASRSQVRHLLRHRHRPYSIESIRTGIALFTFHKYRKSIDSPIPLDAHGNPISDDDDDEMLGDLDAEERAHLTRQDQDQTQALDEVCKILTYLGI